MILTDHSIPGAKINVAVVDDPTLAELHQRYLGDASPTDVLSFALEQSPQYLEGEIVISADAALAFAAEYHWSAADELLLYAIHGALHLVGYDDAAPRKGHKCGKRKGNISPAWDCIVTLRFIDPLVKQDNSL